MARQGRSTSDVGWRPGVDYVPHRLDGAIRKRPKSGRDVEADRGPVIGQTKRLELRGLRSMGEDLFLTLRADSRVDPLEPSGLNASNGIIDPVTAHDQEVVWGHRQTNLVGGVDTDSPDRVSPTRWTPAHHRSVGREQDRLGAVLHRPSLSSKSRAYLADRHAETDAERVIKGGRLLVVQPDRCDGPSPLDLSFGRLDLRCRSARNARMASRSTGR
jgi:hypothetical protein